MWTDWYIENLRYKTRARGNNGYVDCYGLVWLIYMRELGIRLPLYDGMNNHDVEGEDLTNLCIQDSLRVDTPQVFDAVFLYLGQQPSHIACAINDQEIINIRAGTNVVIEPLYGKTWGGKIHSIYRHKSL